MKYMFALSLSRPKQDWYKLLDHVMFGSMESRFPLQSYWELGFIRPQSLGYFILFDLLFIQNVLGGHV